MTIFPNTTPIVFCDVETTGGNPKTSRITEIACLRYENGVEIDRFVTLVNPQQKIPYSITRLTGITDAMVASAPAFEDIAPRVADIFAGATFCAHNVQFDYGFIRESLVRAGLDLSNEKLCTARLSRRLYPEHRSHSLSAIIKRFGFFCDDRHRALGDTEVLVQFAREISEKDGDYDHSSASGSFNHPPNLPEEVVATLPKHPGVYTFTGKGGEILYVGKSIHIRNRVLSHFSQALRNARSKKIWEEVYDIQVETTASDLGASLLELHKIKTEMPIYNRASRRTKRMWYLMHSTNADGYSTFTLTPSDSLPTNDLSQIYGVFRMKAQAKKVIAELTDKHALCPRILGLEKGAGACFSYQLGKCSGACVGEVTPEAFNVIVKKTFARMRVRSWSYADAKTITTRNSDLGKSERFVVDNWILLSAEVLEQDEPYPLFPTSDVTFDYDMYKVLVRHLSLHDQ